MYIHFRADHLELDNQLLCSSLEKLLNFSWVNNADLVLSLVINNINTVITINTNAKLIQFFLYQINLNRIECHSKIVSEKLKQTGMALCKEDLKMVFCLPAHSQCYDTYFMKYIQPCPASLSDEQL